MAHLSREELRRYARHLAIPSFGAKGQKRLKEASVLVIGAGGLGSPLLLYLAAAGIGKIGIVDYDRVESSNLQRQVLYTEEDIGLYKSEAAAKRLRLLNPLIEVQAYVQPFTSDNALELVANYDIIADGTDNFPSRYLINDACLLTGKPNVYGSIYRFEGQLSVFNLLQEDGTRSPNYRDLYPTPPPPELVPNCAEGGVIGVLPGIIGSLQANEVIKIASGVGEPMAGQLFIFDATTLFARKIRIRAREDYKVTALIDYEQFCNPVKAHNVPEISVNELHQWMQEKKDFQLIDVRQAHEHAIDNIGGQLIPLKELSTSYIDSPLPTVFYCRSGKRSERAVRELQEQGYQNLYNLKGGLLEWAKEIDKNLVV